MNKRSSELPYEDVSRPGRLDVNGVEWWACDPYPTWFRREGGELLTNPAEWADAPKNLMNEHAMQPEDCWGHDNHKEDCDGVVRTKWSGVSCACGARWFCY